MSPDRGHEERDRIAAALGVTPEELLVGKMENLLRDAHDRLDRFLQEGVAEQRGAAEFAIMHLVCRSLADLRAGTLLMGAGCVVQGYSVLRPILESLNLIDLFLEDPQKADDWADGVHHQQFGAANVRKALGLGADEPYSIMCERSHPRFGAAQLSGWIEPDGSGVLITAGLPIEHPQVRLAMVVVGMLTPRVAFAAGRVRVRADMAGEWARCLRDVTRTLAPGVEELMASLQGPGGGDPPFGQDVVEAIRKALENSERLAQEAAAAAEESSSPPS